MAKGDRFLNPEQRKAEREKQQKRAETQHERLVKARQKCPCGGQIHPTAHWCMSCGRKGTAEVAERPTAKNTPFDKSYTHAERLNQRPNTGLK